MADEVRGHNPCDGKYEDVLVTVLSDDYATDVADV